MPTPPLADGADLTAPDGASRFRQQLIADVDELLREHHLRIAQHVEESAEGLYARLVKLPHGISTTTRDKIQKLMPHGVARNRGSMRIGTRMSGQEAPAAVQGRGRGSRFSSNFLSEFPSARSTMARNTELLDRTTDVKPQEDANTAELGRDNASAEPEVAPSRSARTSRSSAQPSKRGRLSSCSEEGGKWRDSVRGMVSATISEVEPLDSQEEPEAKMAGADAGNLRARARRFVDSAAFESITGIIILTNAIFFGTETQFMAMGTKLNLFDYVGLMYTGIFTSELILRLLAAGRGFFLGDNWLWNAIDSCVVFMSLVEALLQAADADGGRNLTYVSIIRVARIVRIFQVARVFRVFSSLRMLLNCVLSTLRSLAWTIMLLLSILYIFGILFTQAASEVLTLGKDHFTDLSDRRNYDSLKKYFGGLQWAIYTLFQVVTDGVNWHGVAQPLGWVHPFWEVLFSVFISFTYFAVLNVVTGCFCQSAIESAANDRDLAVQAQLCQKKNYTEQLRELFQRLDSTHSGQVDFHTMESCLRDPDSRAYFEVLGVTPDDAWKLFKLLDDDDDCQIELEEFVSGCLRLRGNSRSIDSHLLLYESRWTMRKVESLLEAFHGLLEILSPHDSAATAGASEPDATGKRTSVCESAETAGARESVGTGKHVLICESVEAMGAHESVDMGKRASIGERFEQQPPEAPSDESTIDSPGSGSQGKQNDPPGAGQRGEPADSGGARRQAGPPEEDSRSAELIGDLTRSSVAKL